MTEKHEHGDIAKYHDRVLRSAVLAHLEKSHGIEVDNPRQDIYRIHATAHPMKAEAPEKKVEALAQRLYEKDSPDNRPTWDEVGQETRDHYRDRARTNLAAQADAENARKIVRARVNQPEPGSEGERQILVDRIICAMVEMDFDGTWVRDDSLSMRGAMRRTYGGAAANVLHWLERGGAMVIPGYDTLGKELEEARGALQQTTEERDSIAELYRTAVREVTELKTDLEESQRQRQGLFEEMGELRQQLERAQEAGRILEAQRDEALERAADRDAVTVELLRLQEVAAGLEAERNGLAQKLAQVEGDTEHLNALTARVQTERTESDRKRYETTQQLQRVSERLIQRTQALATGQAALGEFISELRRVKPDPSWHEIQHSKVIERLEAILEGSRLTSGVIVVEDGQPALGYATTGELIEEVRTRIDLGHCGLGYRTVDEDDEL